MFYGNIGVISKNKVIKTASNVYTVDFTQLQYALKESLNYYVNLEGWKRIGYAPRKLSKRIKGLKGKIVSEINKGKDTTKLKMMLKMELEELDRRIGNNVEVSKADYIKRIKYLLDELNDGYDERLTIEDFFWSEEQNIWNLSIDELEVIEDDVRRLLDK